MTSPQEGAASLTPDDDYPEGDDVCGWNFDHDTEITYEGVDGLQWVCRHCGAEGWEEPHA